VTVWPLSAYSNHTAVYSVEKNLHRPPKPNGCGRRPAYLDLVPRRDILVLSRIIHCPELSELSEIASTTLLRLRSPVLAVFTANANRIGGLR
jgi:hypothetical protein